jgi:hypothetical protein
MTPRAIVERHGAIGTVAVNLFRSQKCSTRQLQESLWPN